jgi:hypothetical protein
MLEAGTYDIRIKLHTASPEGLRYSSDMYWEFFQESVADDFSYPGRALLAFRGMATDQLSGGLPKVDLVATRGNVSVYVPALESYQDKASNNPAWACYDMLHNSDYGGGVHYDRIDYPAFEEWADECDNKGWTVNVYFDTIVSLRKALDIISMNGRAAVVQVGSRFSVIQDRAEDEPVQGFLFSMGNINRDSFAETFLPMEARADAVEVTYFDEDLDYSRQTLEIAADDYDTTLREVKKASLELIGCTDRDLAIRHGRYMLNCTRLLTLAASFEADVDALACRPGDILKVQHDVPQWGYGGRIVSATADTVTLDREVTMYPGTAYFIEVRHITSDQYEIQAIAPVLVETTTDVLTLVGAWTYVPEAFTVYSFGAENRVTKLLRVQKISRSQDMTRKLHCVEYLPEVYVDTGDVPAIEAVSDLAFTIGLAANEIYKGGAETIIALTWRGTGMLWNVWQKVGEGNWKALGTTRQPYLEISNLDYGMEYTFCVSHSESRDDGLTVDITPSGKTTLPADVSAVTGAGQEDGALFEWPKVTDFDLKGYHVKHGIHWMAETDVPEDLTVVPTEGDEKRFICTTPGVTGASEPTWPASGTVNDGTAVWTFDDDWDAELVDTNHYKKELSATEKQVQATGALVARIWVRAVDAFGNESDTVATATAQCLNQKAFVVTVGAEAFDGKYGDISFALARMTAGGTLVLKNGIYQMVDAPIVVPDVNLDIIGETKEGVKVRNAAGENLFEFTNLARIFRLFNFTIESQNTSGYSRMVEIDGDAYGDITAEISLENIDIFCAGAQEFNGDGDEAVYAHNGTDALKLRRIMVDGGKWGIHATVWTGPTTIAECRLVDATFAAILVDSGAENLKVIDNQLVNAWYYGLSVSSASLTEADISQNFIVMRDVDSSLLRAVYVSALKTQFIGNKVLAKGTTTPVIFFDGTDCVIISNYFEFIKAATSQTSVVYIIGLTDSRIADNGIKGSNTDGTSDHRGLVLAGSAHRNVVHGNSIDMVNNTAKEIGIVLDNTCNNNNGASNVTYRVGTSISDAGTGNTVTASDS